MSAVTTAVRYVGPSFDVRNFVNAAANGEVVDEPEAMFNEFRFAVGSETDAPASVEGEEVALLPPTLFATTMGLPITWTTLPSSNLYSSTTLSPFLSTIIRPRKINLIADNGTFVTVDACSRNSHDVVDFLEIDIADRGVEGEDVSER